MRKTRASAANKRLSGWCRAFIVLFVLFFAAGFAFLGSFRSTGEALSYTSEGTPVAVYNLEKTEDQSRLAAVYINVGKIYIQPGEDVTVTVRRATTANSVALGGERDARQHLGERFFGAGGREF